MPDVTDRRPLIRSLSLWLLSIIVSVLCFTYQDRTGPTYPLEGTFPTQRGRVHFKFLRSETIGNDLKVLLVDPLPEGLTGHVKYRRFKSNDDWATLQFKSGVFAFSRRGRSETVQGIGAELPTLKERAGKYEYFVYVDDGRGDEVSITGEKPIHARYKADVPAWVLILHIVVIFASMTLAARSMLEALADGRFKWMLQATVASLLLGAFVLGPLVQWYAFGVWWSGIPFGYDWTDNKVLAELIFWLFALLVNRGDRRNRWSVYTAGILTLIVYFIPHSIFGSEYDYTTGMGHGTAG